MKYWLMILPSLAGYTDRSIALSKTIHNEVLQLERSSCVITGGVGFTGEDNPTAAAYRKLFRIAPDSVWVRLSYSEKLVLRMYAFIALLNKNSSELDLVEGRLKTDTGVVCEISDDITETNSIGNIVSAVMEVKRRQHGSQKH